MNTIVGVMQQLRTVSYCFLGNSNDKEKKLGLILQMFNPVSVEIIHLHSVSV